MRSTFKSGWGGKRSRRKSHVCTYCGRVHPRGKSARAKARAQGWLSCSAAAIRRKLGQH